MIPDARAKSPPNPTFIATALRRALTIPALLAPMAAFGQAESGIEDIGMFGGTPTNASGVSADGSVVVGWTRDPDITFRAFRWTSSGGMVDIGSLGFGNSVAYGVSGDGTVIVGESRTAEDFRRAYRWTSGVGMVELGTLGGNQSSARAISSDGSVVVGQAYTTGNTAAKAVRWTGDGIEDLGTLGGVNSAAYGVSSDGSVIVGFALNAGNQSRAFRWTSNVMTNLGTLGGTRSTASGVSADGSIVVGESLLAGDGAYRAFRWTTAGGMQSLGTLGGNNSYAYAISGDGEVIVGRAQNEAFTFRAIRWTETEGMQTVEDWLRANSVTVAEDITATANATNSDGSVIVGTLASGSNFIARVVTTNEEGGDEGGGDGGGGESGGGGGSGLITLEDVQQSLAFSSGSANMALTSAGTAIHGAHSRPLMRLVEPGRNAFWLAGDWGGDDHGGRSGSIGLAEVGFGRNFGSAQVNVSIGQTWARQNQTLGGEAKTSGTYVLAEALIPLGGTLWATLGGYANWGKADLKRGYLNAGTPDISRGKSDLDSWSLRARVDWLDVWRAGSTDLTPYIDLSHGKAQLDGYTETGGGFPVRFDKRTDKTTELRLGLNAAHPLSTGWKLHGTLEAAHRFQRKGARTSGEVVGLFGFDLDGLDNDRNWLRAGVGVEGALAGGTASVMLNATTKGEAASSWIALGWQRAF